MTTLEKVTLVVREQLCVEESDVKPESSFVALGADSLDIQQLIIELEDTFNIEIPKDDVRQLQTVQDAVNYAESH